MFVEYQISNRHPDTNFKSKILSKKLNRMDQEKIVKCSLLKHESEKNGYHYPSVSSKEVSLKDIKNQIIAVNVGALNNLHAGMNLVYSNLIIDEFDRDTISWFASIIGIAIPIGAGVCGLMVDRYGRRLTSLAVLVPSIFSWFLMYSTRPDQINIIYFSRFLSGLSGGMGTVSSFYVSELSHAKYRAAFSGLILLHASLGVLVVSVLQIFFTWQQTALICCLFFTILLILSIYYLPESPVWLAKFRSDLDGAKRTLRSLISNDEIFEKEWASLSETVKLEGRQQKNFSFFKPSFFKPMTMLLVIFFLQQCTGSYLTMAYLVDMFPRLCPTLGQQYSDEIFLMYGIIRLVSALLGTLVTVRVDRKPLLVWSNVCSFVPCFFIVLITKLYYVKEAENGANIFEWIVMLLFLCYFFANTVGVVAVPWSLNSDLWSTEDRGIGGTIISAFSFLIFFGFSKVFPFAVDETGILFMFQLFGVSSMLMAVYSQIYVPETLGKSYEEIQQHFTNKSVIEESA